MKKKTIAYILIGLAVAAALYFFFARSKKQDNLDGVPAGGDAFDALDDVYYKRLKARMNQNPIVKKNMPWVLQDVASRYESGGGGIDGSYMVNGRASKSGILMAVYAAGVYPYSGDDTPGNVKPDDILNNDLYTIFGEFQIKAAELTF